MVDVFISYQRGEQPFVEKLKDELIANGKQVWVDLEDIPKAADWMQEIYRGIEEAAAFVAIVTPQYLTSEICAKEVSHALLHKKQIIPLVRDLDPKAVPDTLSSLAWEQEATRNWDMLRALNWIYSHDGDSFTQSFNQLVEAVETDLDFERMRARLTTRTREWEDKGRNTSFFLRGAELSDAEQWLAQSSGKKLGASPNQITFITESRRAANARQRVVIGSLSAGIIISLVLAIFAGIAATIAQRNFVRSESLRLAAVASGIATGSDPSEDKLAGVLLAVRSLRMQSSAQGQIALAQTLGTMFPQRAFIGHRHFENQTDVLSAALSPDGRYALTGGYDNTVRLWDTSTGVTLHVLDCLLPYTVAFMPAGDLLTGCSQAAILWDAETGERLHEERIYTVNALGHVARIAFSPDGSLALLAGSDGTVYLWNVEERRVLLTFNEHEGGIPDPNRFAQLRFLADGQQVLSVDHNGKALIWNAQTGEVVETLRDLVPDEQRLYTLAYSPDGSLALTGGFDGRVSLWDAASGEPRYTLARGLRFMQAATFSPDGRYAAVYGDRAVYIWDVETGQTAHTLTGVTPFQVAIAFTPDNNTVLTAGRGVPLLWYLSSTPLISPEPLAGAVRDVLFSADGRLALTAGEDNSVRVWDTQTAEEIGAYRSEELGTISAIALSPDSRRALVAGNSPFVWLWDVVTGETLHAFDRPGDNVAFSPDGRYIATGNNTDGILIWDAATYEQLASYSGYGTPTSGLAFTPDGEHLLIGSYRSEAYLVVTLTGEVVQTYSDGNNVINAVEVSDDSRWVLTGNGDGKARLFDAETGQLITTLSGHSVPIRYVAMDGHYALTADWDGIAKWWDLSTGAEIGILGGQDLRVYAVALAGEGRYALTGTSEQNARLWINETLLINEACTVAWRDFTPEERERYELDNSPTCAGIEGAPAVTQEP